MKYFKIKIMNQIFDGFPGDCPVNFVVRVFFNFAIFLREREESNLVLH